MALVAKSTINDGRKMRMSAINATGLMDRVGSPGNGFVRCASVTGPPNMVAHELNELIKIAAISVWIRFFFMLCVLIQQLTK